MQKLITKYGLAAHLAFLAVAPLFLSWQQVLWLTLLGAIWLVMGPSQIRGESLHQARRRVYRGIVRDPYFWATLVLAGVAALRWINNGIAMAYDPENASWSISEPTFPLMPSAAGEIGGLGFAAALALVVVLQGCRQALGRSARFAFLLLASTFAGYVAVYLGYHADIGEEEAVRLMVCSMLDPDYLGAAFGIYLICGMVALIAAFEKHWHLMFPFFVLAIGGNAAGLFFFAPPITILAFAAAVLLLLVYIYFYGHLHIENAGEFRYLAVFSVVMAAGIAFLMTVMPQAVYHARLDAILEGKFLPETFRDVNAVLSGIAAKVWQANPWAGTGIGTMSLNFRFLAEEEDWFIISSQQVKCLNGYWQLLAERGIVGAVTLAILLGFPLFTFVRRLVGGIRLGLPHPACWAGLLAILPLMATGLFDCSFLNTGILLAAVLTLSVSASTFAKERKHHGE